jgi:hypothetical protein
MRRSIQDVEHLSRVRRPVLIGVRDTRMREGQDQLAARGAGSFHASRYRAWLTQLARTYDVRRSTVRLHIAESVAQLLQLGAAPEVSRSG